MKKAILGLAIFFSCSAFAQTKKIAHRSHSGKDNTLVMTTADNFGLPDPNYKRKDTVVVKKDTASKKVVKMPVRKIKNKKHKATRID